MARDAQSAGEAGAPKSPLSPEGQKPARGLSEGAIKLLRAAKKHQYITVGDLAEGDEVLGPFVFAKLKSSPHFIRVDSTEQDLIDLERAGLIRPLTDNPHDNRYIITPKGLQLLREVRA